MEYELIVERKGTMDTTTLKVEPKEGMGPDALSDLSKKISERLKVKTNLSFKIEPVATGGLPRYTLKSKRFKDLRKDSP